MGEEFTIESPEVPSRLDFTGTRSADSGYSVAAGGYAQQIKKLAVRLRGNHELGYIRQDTPAAVLAGKTRDEAMEIARGDMSIWESAQADAPYILDESDPANPRYQGTPEQWQALEDQYSWVEDYWADAPGPDPGNFDSAIGDLVNSSKALYDQSTGITAAGPPWMSANRAINMWSSPAATTFRNNMWYRMPNIIRRQASVAAVMAHGLAAERDTWVEHRRSLKDTAEKTIVALKAVEVDQPDNSAAALTVFAGIFTAAAGVVAFPFTGGTSTAAIAAGATIVGGALTVAAGEAGYEEGKRREVKLGAATVDEVLFNMTTAVSGADSDVEQNEQKIIDGLQAVYDYITDKSTTESAVSDIPEEELPEGVQPGQFDEKTYTPRQKVVLPRPAIVGDAAGLPDPPIAT